MSGHRVQFADLPPSEHKGSPTFHMNIHFSTRRWEAELISMGVSEIGGWRRICVLDWKADRRDLATIVTKEERSASTSDSASYGILQRRRLAAPLGSLSARKFCQLMLLLEFIPSAVPRYMDVISYLCPFVGTSMRNAEHGCTLLYADPLNTPSTLIGALEAAFGRGAQPDESGAAGVCWMPAAVSLIAAAPSGVLCCCDLSRPSCTPRTTKASSAPRASPSEFLSSLRRPPPTSGGPLESFHQRVGEAAEPFGFPPITLLAECPDKMLNYPKMLKRKGKAEGCEANALPLPQGLKYEFRDGYFQTARGVLSVCTLNTSR
ncbi:hypothetical protein EYF80_016371 [Liparis tanakae]|uniref:Uncharacterized protein n=1 Tax=Liparis tanakae TaxID=230148 RepID=A0A4Z2I5V9_9TELE|nr:hypothetical protein EYF80_016371 [Liparis tanakae]